MTGTCVTCDREFKLRDGFVVFHRQRNVWSNEYVGFVWPQPPCPGWNKQPKEASA